MFDKIFNKKNNQETISLKNQLTEKEHRHLLIIAELKKDNELTLKEKEFELKHFKDDEMKELQDKLNTEIQNNAVLKKENEMLDKITNLNADIIDIKDLVANLINKLPEIKFTNLSAQNNGNDDK